jgi:hypothetical protein
LTSKFARGGAFFASLLGVVDDGSVREPKVKVLRNIGLNMKKRENSTTHHTVRGMQGHRFLCGIVTYVVSHIAGLIVVVVVVVDAQSSLLYDGAQPRVIHHNDCVWCVNSLGGIIRHKRSDLLDCLHSNAVELVPMLQQLGPNPKSSRNACIDRIWVGRSEDASMERQECPPQTIRHLIAHNLRLLSIGTQRLPWE